MKQFYLFLFAALLLTTFNACKKTPVTVIDFSKQTITDDECRVTSTDTSDWINTAEWTRLDSSVILFRDTFNFNDTVVGKIHIAPICPNPSKGLFVWNVSPAEQCRLKVVCVNTKYDLLYLNSYLLQPEPVSLIFDFRGQTAFHPNNDYRFYYAFTNSKDSIYFKGHGDFRIE